MEDMLKISIDQNRINLITHTHQQLIPGQTQKASKNNYAQKTYRKTGKGLS